MASRVLEEQIRTTIRNLRKSGFTYKVFYTHIEYKPMD